MWERVKETLLKTSIYLFFSCCSSVEWGKALVLLSTSTYCMFHLEHLNSWLDCCLSRMFLCFSRCFGHLSPTKSYSCDKSVAKKHGDTCTYCQITIQSGVFFITFPTWKQESNKTLPCMNHLNTFCIEGLPIVVSFCFLKI